MGTRIANMRRLVQARTNTFLIFRAPFVALSPANGSTETVAVSAATGVAHIAGIDLGATIGIVLNDSKVALYLALDRRWSFADVAAYLADRMPLIETIFDL